MPKEAPEIASKAEKRASYYAVHKDHERETHAAWKAANKAHLAEYQAVYYAKNRPELLANRIAYGAAHKEQIAAYYVAHKSQSSLYQFRSRMGLKLAAFNAYGGPRCSCCGYDLFEGLTIDHISDGTRHKKETGTGIGLYRWLKKNNYPPGFQVLCGGCNLAKGTGSYCPHEDLRIAWG